MRNSVTFKVFMITALFFLSSCKEYFITTKINSDGTVERKISCRIDEVNGKTDFPESFLMDSVWSISRHYDSTSKKNTFNAEIKFPSFEKAVAELKKPRRNFDPVIDVNIEKHFKLFFTYYTYKETYRPYNIFKKIPLDKYFSSGELKLLKEGTDSIWTKNKLDEYTRHNLIEMFYDSTEQMFISKYQIRISDLITPAKTKEFLAGMKEVILNDKENKKAKIIIAKYFDKLTAQRIAEYLSDSREFDRMYNSMSRYDGKYENAVLMPGIITLSNSKTIEGNKVSWKFDQEKFRFFEYEMTAESREVNTWTIIVSGIVILLLVFALLLPRFRRKSAF